MSAASVVVVVPSGEPWCKKALYKYSSFPFLSFPCHSGKSGSAEQLRIYACGVQNILHIFTTTQA